MADYVNVVLTGSSAKHGTEPFLENIGNRLVVDNTGASWVRLNWWILNARGCEKDRMGMTATPTSELFLLVRRQAIKLPTRALEHLHTL